MRRKRNDAGGLCEGNYKWAVRNHIHIGKYNGTHYFVSLIKTLKRKLIISMYQMPDMVIPCQCPHTLLSFLSVRYENSHSYAALATTGVAVKEL